MAKFFFTKNADRFLCRFGEQRYKYLQQLKEGEYEEIIQPIEKDKTKEQRGYYFGVIIKGSAEDLGYFADELDEVLRNRHLPKVEGKKGRYQKRMGGLTKVEYSRYIDDCIITLAEMGIAVPPPDRNWNRTNWYVQKEKDNV